MRIYTSYYAKMARDPKDFLLVRISTSMPPWFPYIVDALPELYPGWDLVNGIKSGTIDWAEYTEIYKEKLSKLDRMKILRKLANISLMNDGRDIVLMCYEAPGDPCHRHLVAEWLHAGVKEL